MEKNFQSWTIETEIDYNEEIKREIDNNKIKDTFLLDTNNKDGFCKIEEYVYRIALFHFQRLNITYDHEKHYIEFWYGNRTNINNFHLDCDEYEKKHNKQYIHPICYSVTYFNDNKCPLVITDLSFENYKYKEFTSDEQKLVICFPKKSKHICFDGSRYHGVVDIYDTKNTDRYFLSINLWDRKPSQVPFFNTCSKTVKENIDIHLKKDPENEEIHLDTTYINYDFFSDFLYKKKDKQFVFLKEIIGNNDYTKVDFDNISSVSVSGLFSNYTIKTYKLPFQQKKKYNELIFKYGDIVKDIVPVLIKNSVSQHNIFSNRFVINGFYAEDICKWIINEAENYALKNGGWTTSRHKNYPTTDIPLERIPTAFSYVTFSLNMIFEKIRSIYYLNNFDFNIQDIFIVKYDENKQNELSLHTDGSFLSFNIMLSDKNDYQGGGTYFDNDNNLYYLNRGDVLIHSSKQKHAGMKIIKGTRYILVFFIDLVFSI